ncbi:tRNA lysidine(34) synthetase TilS [Nitratifractor sp.]
MAFSHGLDSTALFHLLLEAGIAFDLAMVDYGIRPEAEKEVEAAQRLAQKHGKRIFVAHAPSFAKNFEARARRFRYDFFEELIDEHGYDNLLTAHQLDDRLEWMLMRLLRGAGAVELAGMEAVSERRTAGGRSYRLLRPLLETTKAQLRDYLVERGLPWFEDGSNLSDGNERSRLRSEIASKLLGLHPEGIRRSFAYLEKDRQRLLGDFEEIVRLDELRILRIHHPSARSRAADRTLKELGHLLGSDERARIDRRESLVAGRRWVIESNGEFLFIAPWLRELPMPKAFREACRLAGIPAKIRPWLYREGIEPSTLMTKREGEGS